jgi:hypothetical protein
MFTIFSKKKRRKSHNYAGIIPVEVINLRSQNTKVKFPQISQFRYIDSLRGKLRVTTYSHLSQSAARQGPLSSGPFHPFTGDHIQLAIIHGCDEFP